MDWITKIIHKQTYDTYNEALEQATKLIDSWCKENGLEYEIKHNGETGCNRVLFIYKTYSNGYCKHYAYSFVVSGCYVGTGEYEERESVFGTYINEKTKYQFYAHLGK